MSTYYDVVIVGGGVTGSSSAYFIQSHPGFNGRIALIEKDTTFQHSPSAKSTGGIRQQFSTPENIEMGLFGAHFIKHIGDYLSVNDETPDVTFREYGYLLIATPEKRALMDENNRRQREIGADIVPYASNELKSEFPWLKTDRASAGYHGVQNEGWVDPYSLLQAYRAKARDLGVALLNEEVVSIECAGDRITSVGLASGNHLSAGLFINTAGASGVRDLAAAVGLSLPIESRKRCTFAFDTKTNIGMTPLTIFPEGVTFRPEGSGYITNAAAPSNRDPDTQDREVDLELFEEINWPVLASWVPAFEAIKITSAWCCHYDVNVLDENAIVDKHPSINNYYFATGFSGHGLQQSPAVGRALSELIIDGSYQTIDLSRMGLKRVLDNQPIMETNCY